MNVKVKKKGNELHVTVSLAPKSVNEKHRSYDISDVVKWLEKNEKAFAQGLYQLKSQTRSVLHDGLGKNYLKGEWVFTKVVKQEVPPAAVVREPGPNAQRATTANAPKKTKAAVNKKDKPADKAVITAEVKPANKRPAKTTKAKTKAKQQDK